MNAAARSSFRAFFFVATFALVLSACSDKGGPSSSTGTPPPVGPPEPPPIANVHTRQFPAETLLAVARGQFDTNNFRDEDDIEKISNLVIADISWYGNAPTGWIHDDYWPVEHRANDNGYRVEEQILRTYRQTVADYERKRRECEDEYRDGTCFPKLQTVGVGAILGCPTANFPSLRYGRYCGLGHPPDPNGRAFISGLEREPIDGVDYCCRLHDVQMWGEGRANECGIAMCLSQASGYPANITELMPDTEEARQCWYDWAAAACPGDFDANAPPPFLGFRDTVEKPLKYVKVP